MLELLNITKIYKVGDIETRAIDGISTAFREREFVAVLGESGSGKTTFLNIVGGLDRYTDGELIIKGKKTQSFTDKDWDAYRNNSIGFVFQSYNLITHLSIVSNVEMSMTLSGVSREEKHKRAIEVLNRVGLGDHLHKKPNQLSGGQMQRVAIARALANNPEILLCDEPTGALDSETSTQIMDLIKSLSADRLVIMVTHNANIAEQYADRIINFKDGLIVNDTNPYTATAEAKSFSLKKTSMSFLTALSISFNNIKTKKGRTFLTSFASSIGIIGIAVILSLSTGLNILLNQFQTDTFSEFPIMISPQFSDFDDEAIAKMRQEDNEAPPQFTDAKEVYLYDSSINRFTHINNITNEYLDYVKAVDPKICNSLSFIYTANINTVTKTVNGNYMNVPFGVSANTNGTAGSGGMMTSMRMQLLSAFPVSMNESEQSYLEKNYDLLEGSLPVSDYDCILIVNNRNRIDINLFSRLGFTTENVESISFSDIIGREYKIITNNDYYIRQEDGNYIPNYETEAMYNKSEHSMKIVGIMRLKEDVTFGLMNTGIAYSSKLMETIINDSLNSEIVAEQKNSNHDVFTLQSLNAAEKDSMIKYLGGSKIPLIMTIHPTNFEAKTELLEYLDKYNDGKEQTDKILYQDLAASITTMLSDTLDTITIALIAFAAVSLFVSLIMICIITYTSVLERTKEIGILKSLGARKKDITRVFDAETCLLGIFSGTLGVTIAWLISLGANVIIKNMTDIEDVAQLLPQDALLLIVISTVITMIGGHIPAIIASRKNAVDALRSE